MTPQFSIVVTPIFPDPSIISLNFIRFEGYRAQFQQLFYTLRFSDCAYHIGLRSFSRHFHLEQKYFRSLIASGLLIYLYHKSFSRCIYRALYWVWKNSIFSGRPKASHCTWSGSGKKFHLMNINGLCPVICGRRSRWQNKTNKKEKEKKVSFSFGIFFFYYYYFSAFLLFIYFGRATISSRAKKAASFISVRRGLYLRRIIFMFMFQRYFCCWILAFCRFRTRDDGVSSATPSIKITEIPEISGVIILVLSHFFFIIIIFIYLESAFPKVWRTCTPIDNLSSIIACWHSAAFYPRHYNVLCTEWIHRLGTCTYVGLTYHPVYFSTLAILREMVVISYYNQNVTICCQSCRST